MIFTLSTLRELQTFFFFYNFALILCNSKEKKVLIWTFNTTIIYGCHETGNALMYQFFFFLKNLCKQCYQWYGKVICIKNTCYWKIINIKSRFHYRFLKTWWQLSVQWIIKSEAKGLKNLNERANKPTVHGKNSGCTDRHSLSRRWRFRNVFNQYSAV